MIPTKTWDELSSTVPDPPVTPVVLHLDDTNTT
jgi:hypothetical protein